MLLCKKEFHSRVATGCVMKRSASAKTLMLREATVLTSLYATAVPRVLTRARRHRVPAEESWRTSFFCGRIQLTTLWTTMENNSSRAKFVSTY
jgi:hypothetical protein